MGADVAVARARAGDHRGRRARDPLAAEAPGRRGALLGHVRGRHRRAGAERSRHECQLASRAGLGRLLLEGADPLTRGLHLPLVHDHGPEDRAHGPGLPAGLRRQHRPPLGAPDRTADDRVRRQGGVARFAHDRVRGAPDPDPARRGDRRPARMAGCAPRARLGPPARGAPRRDRRRCPGSGGALRDCARAGRHPGALQRRGGQLGCCRSGRRERDGLGQARRLSDRHGDRPAHCARHRRRPRRRSGSAAQPGRPPSGSGCRRRMARAAAGADPRRGRRLRRRAGLSRGARAHLARAGRRTGAAARRLDARGNGRALDLLARLAGQQRGRHAVQAVVRARAQGQQVRDRGRPQRRVCDAGQGRDLSPGRGLEGHRRLRGRAAHRRRREGGDPLPPGRIPLRDVGGRARHDGRRSLLARLQQRRLDGPVRRQLLQRRERAAVAEARRLPAQRPVRERQGQVRQRQSQIRRRPRGQRQRLRRRRLQRRRLHRSLHLDGRRRQAALEQRQRHVHPGRAAGGRRFVRLACGRGGCGREWRRAARPLRRRLHQPEPADPELGFRVPRRTTSECAICSS